jgi:hypothetical protein
MHKASTLHIHDLICLTGAPPLPLRRAGIQVLHLLVLITYCCCYAVFALALDTLLLLLLCSLFVLRT